MTSIVPTRPSAPVSPAIAEQALVIVTLTAADQPQAAITTLAAVVATEVIAAVASVAACQEVHLIAAPEVPAAVAAPVEEEDKLR